MVVVWSWMDSTTGKRISDFRPSSYVTIHHIKRVWHHVHAERLEEFNRVVNLIFSTVDSNKDKQPQQSPWLGVRFVFFVTTNISKPVEQN